MSSDEVEDCDDNAEQAEVEGLDEQKSIILHLLSQLKLGMDLTKVSVMCSDMCNDAKQEH